MRLSTKNLLFITLISSLFLLVLVLLKQQNYSANTQTLALTDYQPKAVPPISATKNKELSCSDCTAQGKDTICFNVEANRATCGNINSSQNINTLCRKCSAKQPKPTVFLTPKPHDKCYYMQRSDQTKATLVCPSISPKPTCTPRPACLDQEPRCMFKMEPIGGWCPKKITITPQYCLQVMTPARNLTTKECKTFSNSCIPEGWMKDSACSETPPADQYLQ